MAVSSYRQCSRTACSREAVATLTYVYSDSTAVLGPLAIAAEPHSYDLCQAHASRLTAPRGWEVVRVTVPGSAVQPEVPAEIEEEVVVRPAVLEGVVPAQTIKTRRMITEDNVGDPELDEFEQRKIEISKPLTQPDDDWAAIADVVRTEEKPVPLTVTQSPASAVAPEGFIPPENLMRPRHAAEPEAVQQGEVARRGHLRMLRDDS